jgi:hypothetical protein
MMALGRFHSISGWGLITFFLKISLKNFARPWTLLLLGYNFLVKQKVAHKMAEVVIYIIEYACLG